MRLLRYSESGELTIRTFDDSAIPSYAILSHTWGADRDEVTFTDLETGGGKTKAGYNKIVFCGRQARQDGLQYFWIDTCCIDKSNSSELLESLNLMYKWYQTSTKCYIILSDVTIDDPTSLDDTQWLDMFQKSRWFTRGWTLQELIAPANVEFYSWDGTYLGNKQSLESILHDITKIPSAMLRGASLSRYSLDERMTWGARRKTSRPEDKAYCMLGLCEVFLPFMYGWGESHAMFELRQKVQHSQAQIDIISQSVIRIGGASYNDLVGLNDEQLAQLDAELLAWLKWFEEVEERDYYDSVNVGVVGIKHVFKIHSIDYDDSLTPKKDFVGGAALMSYREMTKRKHEELDIQKRSGRGTTHLCGFIAFKTCVEVLVWRGHLGAKN